MSSNFIERLERIEAKLDEVIAALHAYDDDQLHCEYSGLPSVKAYEDEPRGGPCSKHDEASWDEERMDIIGQNGNEGLHYDENEFDDYGKRVVKDKDKSNNTQTNDVGEKKRNKRKYYKPKQTKNKK